MIQPHSAPPHLPPKPPHNPLQLLLCLLRPRRQLTLPLPTPLLNIIAHNTALLRPLRRTMHRRAIHGHLNALLIPTRLARPRRRKILWRCVCVVIHGRGFGIRACSGGLLVRRLSVGVVRLVLCVEGEVVLWDLAVAFAFRVRYQELVGS